jgi:uncharacterized 2Fe-2S/4Fe-4S cluster protein (DUF4445 family)/ferredoxin
MTLTVESAKGRQTLTLPPAEQKLRLTDLLRRKHLPLNTRCGQRGLCDGCLVEFNGSLVRGCEINAGELTTGPVRIPARSLLAYEPQVVSEFKLNVPRAHDPLWQQVELPVGGVAGLHRRRPIRLAVPEEKRRYATLEYRDDHWLVTGFADAPEAKPLGVAVDIGTTTVALLVCDLRDGKVLAGAANFNKQMHLGDDVLTRINLCSTDPTQLQHLRDLVVNETIVPLLHDALAKAGPGTLRSMAIAANTTMLHIFAGVDPTSMGVAPFTPTFLEHRIIQLPEFPCAIHLLPGAAAYVGADLTAGALATGLMYDDGPSLLVDVGTNGEIVLKRGDHLFGCATAAGPAFEGAGLTHGVRAADGAISHLHITGQPFAMKLEKIGAAPPMGLCGTAYVDFLAQGRAAGLLNERGRFESAFESHTIPWKDYGRALKIAREIVVVEVDIASLLQAKAAIAAGILTLLERIGLRPAEIKTLYLAGGFGLHLVKEHAIGCGLLPGFKPDQIEVVGNTSLAGAYLALLDCGALDEIARAGQRMEVVELNLDPGFEDRYVEQLSLP